MKDPQYLELLKKLGLIEDYKNSKDFTKFIVESFRLHKEVVRKLGLDISKVN